MVNVAFEHEITHKCVCLTHNALDLRALQLESREKEMGQKWEQEFVKKAAWVRDKATWGS